MKDVKKTSRSETGNIPVSGDSARHYHTRFRPMYEQRKADAERLITETLEKNKILWDELNSQYQSIPRIDLKEGVAGLLMRAERESLKALNGYYDKAYQSFQKLKKCEDKKERLEFGQYKKAVEQYSSDFKECAGNLQKHIQEIETKGIT